jgi:hypothetical protein
MRNAVRNGSGISAVMDTVGTVCAGSGHVEPASTLTRTRERGQNNSPIVNGSRLHDRHDLQVGQRDLGPAELDVLRSSRHLLVADEAGLQGPVVGADGVCAVPQDLRRFLRKGGQPRSEVASAEPLGRKPVEVPRQAMPQPKAETCAACEEEVPIANNLGLESDDAQLVDVEDLLVQPRRRTWRPR